MPVMRFVRFRFDPPLSVAEQQEMRQIVGTWTAQMPFVRSAHVGPAFFTKPADDNPGMCVTVELDDLDGLAAYQEHPAHLRLGAWVQNHPYTVQIVDFGDAE